MTSRTCPACGGDGAGYEVTDLCPTCGGTGTVEADRANIDPNGYVVRNNEVIGKLTPSHPPASDTELDKQLVMAVSVERRTNTKTPLTGAWLVVNNDYIVHLDGIKALIDQISQSRETAARIDEIEQAIKRIQYVATGPTVGPWSSSRKGTFTERAASEAKILAARLAKLRKGTQ